ncbi:hypothetical protein CBS9595_002059 [Malassezia furfur]|nr:hypothetical protein CBS9595_002059 [Malassezia furfur]
MSAKIPSQMDAWVVQGKGSAKIERINVPKPGSKEILVKVVSMGLSPADWKHLDVLGVQGTILGSDFVGTVAEKGAECDSDLKLGERVAGWVHGAIHDGIGAFAEYLKTSPDSVIRVPDNISDSLAAGLGITSFTAYMALYQSKNLGLTPPPADIDRLPPIDPAKKLLVWSGASSVGQFLVQLARTSGCYVIATASLRHADFLKSLGASPEVYDYREPNVADAIAQAHPDLVMAVDAYSEKGSSALCARALSKTQSSRLVTLLYDGDVREVNPRVHATFFLLYTTEGEAMDLFFKSCTHAEAQEDRHFMAAFARSGILTNLLARGLVKPNDAEAVPGGLRAVEAGVDRVRRGDVTGKKLTIAL